MLTGATILLIGIFIGSAATLLTVRYLPNKKQTSKTAYEKYKNKDGLYSCRAVKEVGE
jgi:uncharacterized membrane protein YdjX (TVP38/TMEM64 family)